MTEYSDLYREQYTKNDFEINTIGVRRALILHDIWNHKAKRILEIGCGMKPLFTSLKFKQYTLVEPEESFIQEAMSLLKEDVSGSVEFINKHIEDSLSLLEKKKFDYIVISSLLHEVEFPDAILEVVHKLCSSTTRVNINVPNADSLHRRLGELILGVPRTELSQTDKSFGRHRVFNSESLKVLVESNHFTVSELDSYLVKPFHNELMKIISDFYGDDADTLLISLNTLHYHTGIDGCELRLIARRTK